MISKYSKSYDTSDGSERQREEVPSQDRLDARADRRRREDDGEPLDAKLELVVQPLAWKPAWSVLSLRDLNEAIRQEHRPDNPVRVEQESNRIERKRIRTIEADREKGAALALADQIRYRNAWENT